jgi:Pvc16 N-terminal domain
MKADAVQVVTKALQDLLTTTIGTVYVGPLDDPQASGAKAVLFLYRVAVNPDLRNSPHVVPPVKAGDPPVVYDNALPLDLFYLLTPGDAQVGGELDALGTLGQAMQVLQGDATLTGVPVQGETVRVTLDPISSEEMSRIWTLFPTANYRTSVVYLATPVWIDPTAAPVPAPPVTSEPHRVGPIAPVNP